MPTFVTFSPDDMLRDIVVEPAYYTLLIQGHRTWSSTKDGQSNNCHMDCLIERNADTGATEFAGVPITLQFNDKPGASGFIRGFLRAMGVEIKPDTRYDLEALVGQRVDAFVENEMYNGRLNNRVNHKYRAARG